MVPLNDARLYETVIRRCSVRLHVSVVVTVSSIRIPYSALRVRCLPLLVMAIPVSPRGDNREPSFGGCHNHLF